MSEDKKVTLQVEAVVSLNRLYLRFAGATAELPDGRKMEVAACIDQSSIVVTITSADKKTWTNYFLNNQAIGQAVLAAEVTTTDPVETDGGD